MIGLYYYGEVTMKQIGAEIGVNESRVSQLHARAIRRLRDALGDDGPAAGRRDAPRARRVRGTKPKMAKAQLPTRGVRPTPAVVLPYKPRRAAVARATLKVDATAPGRRGAR